MTKTQHNNYAFIDSQNINLGVQKLGWKMDWRRFRVYLKDKYGISKAYLFIGYKPGNESLYSFLQDVGYHCIFKPTLELPNGQVKGNVDAELVLHIMIQFKNFDQALIVSGDGDFYCLAEYLLKEKKLLKVLVPDENRYSSLFNKLGTPQNKIVDSLNLSEDKLSYQRSHKNEKGSHRDKTLREPLSS